ncbi:cobalamin-dependent protein [Edaphobacter aggregans]|uniref:cobalamin-dependent protein n=1 Tax=Edaphobacter aggregans TaxID=570835 RepID=UPI000A03CF08
MRRAVESAGGADAGGFAEAAASLVAAKDAEVCGFSSICSSYPLTIRIAKAVKAMRPQTTILLGGPQASVVDMSTLTAFPFVDLVLRGEAERTLPQSQAGKLCRSHHSASLQPLGGW